MQSAIGIAIDLLNEAGGAHGHPVEIACRDIGSSEQLTTDAASALINVFGVNANIESTDLMSRLISSSGLTSRMVGRSYHPRETSIAPSA